VPKLLETIQNDLLTTAADQLASRTVQTESVEEAREAAQTGFARIPWRILGAEGEKSLATDAITVRCLQTADGQIPTDTSADDVMAVVGRSY
jgi:prolyl-tRNA synthetase